MYLPKRLSQNAKADLALIEKFKSNALESLLTKISDKKLEDIESIHQWMEGYRSMGLRPKKVKPTHYAFASRLAKDKKWPRSIGPLVDTYLINQITHLMPHGGFDTDKLPSNCTIELLKSEQSVKFQPIGVKDENVEEMEDTKAGEVIYRLLDDSIPTPITLTRNLNYRDGEKTKIVDDQEDEKNSTKDLLLIIEDLSETEEGKQNLYKTANDLEQFYKSVFGQYVEQSYVRILDYKGGESLNLDW